MRCFMNRSVLYLIGIICVGSLILPTLAQAETLVESSLFFRIYVAFSVNQKAAQECKECHQEEGREVPGSSRRIARISEAAWIDTERLGGLSIETEREMIQISCSNGEAISIQTNRRL